MPDTPELHKGMGGAIAASDRPRLLTQASAPDLLVLGANKESSLPSRRQAPVPGVGIADDNNSGSYHGGLWVSLVLFIVVGVLALFWLWRRRQQASISRSSTMTGTELVGNSATTERLASRSRLATVEALALPAEQTGSISSEGGSDGSIPQSGSDFREARARMMSHPADCLSFYTDNPSKKSCKLAMERFHSLHQELNEASPLPWKEPDSPIIVQESNGGSVSSSNAASSNATSSNAASPEEDNVKKASRTSLSSWWNSDSPKAADTPSRPHTETSISSTSPANARANTPNWPEGDEKNEVAPAVSPRPSAQTFCMDDGDSSRASMESGVFVDATAEFSAADTPDAMPPTKSAVAETAATAAESDLQA